MNGARASSFSLCRKVAVIATAMLVSLLVLGMFGRFFWIFDLLTHFTPYLALVLLLSSTMALFCGERRIAIVGLLLCIASALQIVPYVRPRPAPALEQSERFRLVTFNIWHHNSEVARVARFLEHSDADVLVIQEATAMQARQLQQRLTSYRYALLDGTIDDGTIVFSRWPIDDAQYLELADRGARAASLSLRWRDRSVQILGVHLHWPLGRRVSKFRNAELHGLANLAANETARPLLVAGDFNITQWSSYYQQFVKDSTLSDADWGQGLQASWPSVLGPLGISIDHCLHSGHWDVIATRTGPELGSDHLPVIVDLQLRAMR
ncbi:MAG TPA: endonuclease/exonuclease/phosphatase family protein [Steroidobacteraceae bacterium]|nr:endonuclease/exonuclease/phosphatase family protein [Steroidobacteraceae bacterium]